MHGIGDEPCAVLKSAKPELVLGVELLVRLPLRGRWAGAEQRERNAAAERREACSAAVYGADAVDALTHHHMDVTRVAGGRRPPRQAIGRALALLELGELGRPGRMSLC